MAFGEVATRLNMTPSPSIQGVQQRIPVLTVPLDTTEPLLRLLPSSDGVAWVRRGEGLVGWGTFARKEFVGAQRFAEASAWWREQLRTFAVTDDVRSTGTGPVAFGSFAFDEDEVSIVLIPRTIVGRHDGRTWVTTIGDASEVSPSINAISNPGEITWSEGALTPLEWQAAVAWAVSRIQSGDVDKVVLARDISCTTQNEIDPRYLLERLERDYPATWTFSVDGLIGATPELLLRLTRGMVTSRVLAGTIRRTGDDQRDLALAASLARSSKDLEEHEYAVASVADSLAPYCSSTNIPESPFVLHLANVMHLASDVTGVVSDSIAVRDSFSLIESLHPSAAVCGTPRSSAKDLIAEVEGMSRGRYAGPVGWIDGRGDGEWGIALRCAQIDQHSRNNARLFAGCGIVAGSDPESELAESQAKLLPMREALES
jgi:menaquinone-specific isochorismate synthase